MVPQDEQREVGIHNTLLVDHSMILMTPFPMESGTKLVCDESVDGLDNLIRVTIYTRMVWSTIPCSTAVDCLDAQLKLIRWKESPPSLVHARIAPSNHLFIDHLMTLAGEDAILQRRLGRNVRPSGCRG